MLGTRIKQLREERHISQRELADNIKMGTTAIYNYESGNRVPDADALVRLADFFGTTTDYLLGKAHSRTNAEFDAYKNCADEVSKCLYHLRPEARERFLPALQRLLLSSSNTCNDSSFIFLNNLADTLDIYTCIKDGFSKIIADYTSSDLRQSKIINAYQDKVAERFGEEVALDLFFAVEIKNEETIISDATIELQAMLFEHYPKAYANITHLADMLLPALKEELHQSIQTARRDSSVCDAIVEV